MFALRLSRASHSVREICVPTAHAGSFVIVRRSLVHTRPEHTASQADSVPLRKQLKDEAKRRKQLAKASRKADTSSPDLSRIKSHDQWELTVGIEVHAELNTAHKLFSTASSTTSESAPNSHVAPFDAALPGAQPHFQRATLLPALRAALALNCEIQSTSSFDRKHYFYQDQPNGYQITQYYAPFAKNGVLSLTVDDGIDPDDHPKDRGTLSIGIKQIQMEQDTAKTSLQLPETYLLDFNRVSHPLIEIITLPHIHSPSTAAAVVRKIQMLLRSVDACVAGMEVGGLRADVNVSVKRRGSEDGPHEYSGVRGLGTRTEIKNLSSFKAVEDAVTAERDRQIAVLEAGGTIEGETRGWTLGSTETVRLRSKEGEVDYRYMPDPDLGVVRIADGLVEHLRSTLPELPEETIQRAMTDFGISLKDAKTLVSLDDGERLEFCFETLEALSRSSKVLDRGNAGRMVANWVLHEIGGLMSADGQPWARLKVSADDLASIVGNLLTKQITARTAKQLLQQMYNDEAAGRNVEELIEEGNLRLHPITGDEYRQLAQSTVEEHPDIATAIREKGQRGKIMFFVGQMMRRADEGTVEAEKARQVVEELFKE